MRVYIDCDIDESYTPTKMQFFAGTGHHDLQHVCDMLPHNPKGWLDVNLKNAGGPPALREDEEMSDEEWDQQQPKERETVEAMSKRLHAINRWRRTGTGPTLRCYLVQVRIVENHQNGKDTHLRGLQIFARDESYTFSRRRNITQSKSHGTAHQSSSTTLPNNNLTTLRTQGHGVGGESTMNTSDTLAGLGVAAEMRPARRNKKRLSGGTLREPDWIGELETKFGQSDLR